MSYPKKNKVTYVEIGCYAGGSACLMLQRKNTQVISIDLGEPILKEIVYRNVAKHNVHTNQYAYIQGSSHLPETISQLSSMIEGIDILFIDGDHKYAAVKKDFEMYSHLVKPGGYIVFDDYNDSKYSPEVKIAVDEIVKSLNTSYKIKGTFLNTLGARPSELIGGNCFIIQK
jgi:predicted O-methyltransferase YrrM